MPVRRLVDQPLATGRPSAQPAAIRPPATGTWALPPLAHAEPVFLAHAPHPDIDRLVEESTAGEPLYDVTAEDGVRHIIWQAPDPDIKNCRMFLHGRQLLVALPSDTIAVKASKRHPDLPFDQIHSIDVKTGKSNWASPVMISHATRYSMGEWEDQPFVQGKNMLFTNSRSPLRRL